MDLMLIPQPSCDERVQTAKNVMGANSHELGFVPRSALIESARKNQLIVIDDVCFVHFRIRRDDQVTIYEVGVLSDFRGKGYGSRLINQVRLWALKSRKRKIIAKCPEDLPSNGFYSHIGFRLASVQKGKKRRLNVWEMTL